MARNILWFATMLLITVGCSNQPDERWLIGRWEGRPVTAAQRDPNRMQHGDDSELGKGELSGSEPWERSRDRSNPEGFDFTIHLDFADSSSVKMAMTNAQGRQSKTGTWKVVRADGNELITEIAVGTDSSSNSASQPSTGNRDTRQFRIRFELRNPNRFKLKEIDADPSQRALLFVRDQGPAK